MASDVKAKTIFTVHSNLAFICNPRNRRFLVNEERILEDEPNYERAVEDEDATPAPEDPISQSFLRITTDDLPKIPSEGYVFGRDPAACDIFLEPNSGVSRKQFALQVVVNYGEGSFVLKNFGRYGTTLCSAGGSQRIKNQQAISHDQQEFTIYIGCLQIRIAFFNHGQHWDTWQKHWRSYCLNYDEALLPPAPVDSVLTSKIPWTEDYHSPRKIGSGAYGTVYRVLHRTTAHVYAIKEYHGAYSKTHSEFRLLDQLRSVKHEHIVKYFGFRTNPPAVVMEFLDGSNLWTAHEQDPLQSLELRDGVTQIASALDYLHGLQITHRDLKPENIMVSARRPIHIKLCDFGLAINKIHSMRTFCGTLKYSAPELRTMSYSTKVDMWSLGVLIYEFSYGLPLYESAYLPSVWHITLRRSLDKLQNQLPRNGLIGLIDDLLDGLPRCRPSARQILDRCMDFPWDAPLLADPDEVTGQDTTSSSRVAGASTEFAAHESEPPAGDAVEPVRQPSTYTCDETGHVRFFR